MSVNKVETSVDKVERRQEWMRLLARAPQALLEECWQEIAGNYEYQVIRKPEVGLAMVQARACGSGAPFNCGEMPLTRCAVRIGSHVGHGYVQGRRKGHAELMAVFDAILQDDAAYEKLSETFLAPIGAELEGRSYARREAAQKTKVDFFTMVRGEDEE